MADKLRMKGAEVTELPAIETRLLSDSPLLKQTVETIGCYHWLAFTSPSGVELFFEYLSANRLDIRILSGIKIAVIGKATGDMLFKYGICADYMPEQFYAKDLGEGLSERVKPEERLLILRAREGSAKLLEPLHKKKLRYEDVPLYETIVPAACEKTERVKKLLENREFDFVTFTSISTVDSFMKTLCLSAEAMKGFTAVCIGEETKKRAEELNMCCLMAELPSMDKMVEVIEDFHAAAVHGL